MKKISLSIAALALVFAVTFTSCKKDDTGLPVVSLTGDGTITLDLGATWTDPGATATDDNDGAITPFATGTVNTDQVGEYTVTYTATDEAGNVGTATRTVRVKTNKLARTYHSVVKIGGTEVTNYDPVVTASELNYNKIIIANFGNYEGSYTMTATVSGNSFTIPDFTSTGTPVIKLTNISGTFVKTGTGTSATYAINTVNYTEQVGTATASAVVETWTILGK